MRQTNDKARIAGRGAGRGAFGVDEHDVQLRIEVGPSLRAKLTPA